MTNSEQTNKIHVEKNEIRGNFLCEKANDLMIKLTNNNWGKSTRK